ncbi:ABC-2 transporter permease [uncultured Gemmiger sp.]|uniref:ABC-2 transporter permease n=1 Tax=uncultured Gemmiger sp. TaxID=1623490 RepID=UPI0025E21C79|nr:ABC-2 transporter permease [uncultured Gemmiger sp.]
MKGLLYKDISIMTRSFKGNILLLMALYGVLILVTREAYLAYAMTAVWGIYVASTINYDEQAHWDAYAATLPVTPGQVIGSKYLLCAASTAIGAVLSLALVFLAGVGGAEYTLGILACAEVSVLMNALLMPITYRFGAAKSRAYLMIIVFAIVFGACFVAQEILQNRMLRDSANMDIALQSQTAIVVGAVALSLLLTAVLYAISYTVCVRIYAKKEK